MVSRNTLIAIGVTMMILGIVALFAAVATTIVSVTFVGIVLIIAAVLQGGFSLSSGRWTGVALHLLLAVLYLVSGFYLITNPLLGAVPLTMLLGFFFVVGGLFRIVASLYFRFASWGLAFFSGIVSFALGLYTLFYLPQASAFLIGILVGVDVLFYGIHLTAFGFVLKSLQRTTALQGQQAY